MLKLVAKYKAEPNAKNLAAVKKHLNKHPMAAVYLTPQDYLTFS